MDTDRHVDLYTYLQPECVDRCIEIEKTNNLTEMQHVHQHWVISGSGDAQVEVADAFQLRVEGHI